MDDIYLYDILLTWFSVDPNIDGRVLDSRPKGRGFKPHRHHCVLVLEQDILVLVQPRKTGPCLTERLLMGRKE